MSLEERERERDRERQRERQRETETETKKRRERERERVTLTLLFSLLINCIKELETILPSHTPHNMNWRNIFIKEALVILRKNTHR